MLYLVRAKTINLHCICCEIESISTLIYIYIGGEMFGKILYGILIYVDGKPNVVS